MFGSPHYKLCQSCPWGQVWPRLGGLIIIGKHSNIGISKASWRILIKFHTQHYLAVRKVAYCFGADRTGTLVAMEKQILFSEITGPTALIFGMWQWLMVFYLNFANHAPGVKFGHAPGVDSLHRLTIGKHSNIGISKTSRLILIKLHFLMVLHYVLTFNFFPL